MGLINIFNNIRNLKMAVEKRSSSKVIGGPQIAQPEPKQVVHTEPRRTRRYSRKIYHHEEPTISYEPRRYRRNSKRYVTCEAPNVYSEPRRVVRRNSRRYVTSEQPTFHSEPRRVVRRNSRKYVTSEAPDVCAEPRRVVRRNSKRMVPSKKQYHNEINNFQNQNYPHNLGWSRGRRL